MKPAKVEMSVQESIPVVSIEGDLDVTAARRVRDQLLASVRNHDSGLVVDLSAARYLDSAGVNVLFELADLLDSRQLALAVVVADDGIVNRVLKIVDVASVATVTGTLPDALASFAERS